MNIEESIPRRIVVIGANGGIGKQAVVQALEQGYVVVAVVRNPDSLGLSHPKLAIKKADVMKPDSLEDILKKDDVVISAIGKNSTGETTLYSQGDRHILQAMMHAGASRFFAISAGGLEVNPTHNLLLRWATKNILQRVLKNMYADLIRMEHVVKGSDLNWTLMRPPRLTDGAAKGNYRFSINDFVKNGQQISRADVAGFMLNNLDNLDTFRKTVELAY
jgi:putative NADH-flavin reductase